MKTRTTLLLLCALCTVLAVCRTAGAADAKKPVLLYSRYFNAKGETRYLPDGTRQTLKGSGVAGEIFRVSDLLKAAQAHAV